jgi:hypothetical protein
MTSRSTSICRKQKHSGTMIYRVRSEENGQFIITQSGHLGQQETWKEQRLQRGIPHFPPPHAFAVPHVMSRQPPHEFKTDDRGRILRITGQAPLPYALGDAALLVIEPFAKSTDRTWEFVGNSTVYEREQEQASIFPRFGRFAQEQTTITERPLDERLSYRVVSATDGEVTIRKQGHFKSGDESAGAASREQETTGDVVFDTKRGVISKADLKVVTSLSEGNVTLRVPMQVKYRLLDEAEMARRAEEQKAAFAKMAEERAKAEQDAARPLTDDEARELIAALADPKSRRAAAEKLHKKKQADEHREAIAHALDPLLSDSDHGVRDVATQALKIWATAENVSGLVNLVMHEDGLRGRAMEALGPLKDKRGAEAVAALFVTSRGEARKSLEQMGPVAEPYVLPLLDNPDQGVRADACRVLAVIGTSASRTKLEKLGLKPRGGDAEAAREALQKIEAR